MSPENKSWDEYRLLVLQNIGRLEKQQEKFSIRLNKMEVAQVTWQAKAGVWQIVIGAVIGFIIQVAAKFISTKLATGI